MNRLVISSVRYSSHQIGITSLRCPVTVHTKPYSLSQNVLNSVRLRSWNLTSPEKYQHPRKLLPSCIRYCSTIFIPEAPPIPAPTPGLDNLEPAFESLGLGGWSPSGLVQSWFEYLHIGLDLPWWAAIVTTTILLRIALFPLVIKLQRHAAIMHNNMPAIQALSLKMSEARQSGDYINAAKSSNDMMEYMKKKNISPLKTLIAPVIQIPIFLSMFTAIRGMTNCPVDSMMNGGLYWFSDLTVSDPYYLLPLITSSTLFVTMKVGSDVGTVQLETNPMMKYIIYVIPLITFPFVMNFPAALPLYWMTSNFVSLLTVAILRIDPVRKLFKIEKRLQHDRSKLAKKKGFVDGMSDAWTNMKITNELAHRRTLDEIEFKKAGLGPIERTYKYNPTVEKK